MKIKKLKRLLRLIQEISKKKIEDIHLADLGYRNKVDNKPVFVLPSRGKYCLDETREIIKIIKSIEPNEFITEAAKINRAARMNIIIVFSTKNPKLFEAAVQTPYGIIPFTVSINSEEADKLIEDLKSKAENKLPEAEIL